MDPMSALSVASAVVQFISIGTRVGKLLLEYTNASPGDVPKALASVSTQLPLICHALSRIQTETEVKAYDSDIRGILNGIILGCTKLALELQEIANKIQPKPGESLKTRLRKVFSNLKNEQRIVEIDCGLQSYAQVLILHQVVDRGEIQVGLPTQSDYFEVKEKRLDNFTKRDELIARLDECFYKTVRSQTQQPGFVVLQGVASAGKTQLALEFCYQTHILKQFRTVFWFDVSSPETLKMGLESAACIIRQSTAGTREEKINFVNQFLTDRWHPWLVVLDNYIPKAFFDEPLTDFLPTSGCGAILLTSRSVSPALGTTIKVPRYMTAAEEEDRRGTVTKAIRSRDIGSIKKFIDEGFDVNSDMIAMWKNQERPIINLAADLGFEEIVRLLLDSGADSCHNKRIGSVLTTAAYNNSIAVVTTYLDYEDKSGHREDESNYLFAAKTAITNGYEGLFNLLTGRRPSISWTESREVGEGFAKAAENGHIDMLRLVMSLRGPPIPSSMVATALTDAARAGQLEVMQYLLTEAKIDPNIPDESGRLPLYEATQISKEDMRNSVVGMLMKAGAFPTAIRQSDKRTPLHSAALYGYSSTLEILLKNNPDVTGQDDEGQTALGFAAHSRCDPATYALLTKVYIANAKARKQYFENGLAIAARKGDRDLAMLVMKQIDISSPQNTEAMNSLLLAISNRHTAVSRMMIRNGVKQEIRDKDGKPPLVLAAEMGLDLVVRDLINAKGSPGLEVHDLVGNTPLLAATRANHKSVVETCMKLGADKEAMNDYGETAEDVAEENNLTEILEIFQDILQFYT